jgi:hypothetical protein
LQVLHVQLINRETQSGVCREAEFCLIQLSGAVQEFPENGACCVCGNMNFVHSSMIYTTRSSPASPTPDLNAESFLFSLFSSVVKLFRKQKYHL